jgi:hypothetical protein
VTEADTGFREEGRRERKREREREREREKKAEPAAADVVRYAAFLAVSARRSNSIASRVTSRGGSITRQEGGGRRETKDEWRSRGDVPLWRGIDWRRRLAASLEYE